MRPAKRAASDRDAVGVASSATSTAAHKRATSEAQTAGVSPATTFAALAGASSVLPASSSALPPPAPAIPLPLVSVLDAVLAPPALDWRALTGADSDDALAGAAEPRRVD